MAKIFFPSFMRPFRYFKICMENNFGAHTCVGHGGWSHVLLLSLLGIYKLSKWRQVVPTILVTMFAGVTGRYPLFFSTIFHDFLLENQPIFWDNASFVTRYPFEYFPDLPTFVQRTPCTIRRPGVPDMSQYPFDDFYSVIKIYINT